MQWTIANEHHGMLIRDYLTNEHAFSRRIIKAIIYDGGAILVDGIPRRMRYTLSAGEVLNVQFPPEDKGRHMIPQDVPLDIIYEDEAVLVINKQPGIATIPSVHHPSGTLANGILAHYKRCDIPYTVHIVTRLDRETSGLLLVAKNRYSHSLISRSQREGHVRRLYYAITEGIPTPVQGSINAKIGRKAGSIVERTVRGDGKEAVTHYKVINQTKSHALLDVKLETGRTHQIRVHLSSIGHPLAGDDLYGGSMGTIDRQALHCYHIGFIHPMTNETMSFTIPVPFDMLKIIKG